jgi:hypothetical protein
MKNQLSLLFTTFLLIVSTSCTENKIENLNLIPVKKGENFQYINSNGNVLISNSFSNASVFKNGIALVRTNEELPKWGFIDKKGDFKLNPIYKHATIFSENIAFVVPENGVPTAINTKYKTLFKLQNAKIVRIFKNGLAAFTNHDNLENWGFVDTSGKTVIAETYTEVSNFSENKCAVKNNSGKWGYIDKSGKIILDFIYNEAADFDTNTAIVNYNGAFGVIDEKGNYLITPQFKSLYKDKERYLFEENERWGWCDKLGKIVIIPIYLAASKFNENEIASIKMVDKYGYIDKKGKIIIYPQYDLAFPFNNNLALVKDDNKIGFIDKSGEYKIDPTFDGYSVDYLSNINTGKSIFSEAETDYFDVTKIIEKIDLIATEEVSLDNNYSEILQKFKINSAKIDSKKEETLLVKAKKITSDVTMDFVLLGQLFKNVSETEKVFMSKNKPDGFVYIVKLSGRATGKSKVISNNLKLSHFKLVKSGYISSNPVSIYKNKNSQIVITNTHNNLCIYIFKPDYSLDEYSSSITSTKQ